MKFSQFLNEAKAEGKWQADESIVGDTSTFSVISGSIDIDYSENKFYFSMTPKIKRGEKDASEDCYVTVEGTFSLENVNGDKGDSVTPGSLDYDLESSTKIEDIECYEGDEDLADVVKRFKEMTKDKTALLKIADGFGDKIVAEHEDQIVADYIETDRKHHDNRW